MKKILFTSLVVLYNFATAENFYRTEILDILNDPGVKASLTAAYKNTLDNNYEYCGWIYKKNNDVLSVKTYTLKQQTSCAISSVERADILKRNPGSKILLHFHTHPKTDFGNVRPSATDMDLVIKNELEVDDDFKTSAIIITQSPIDHNGTISPGMIKAREASKGKLTLDIIKTNTTVPFMKNGQQEQQNMTYLFLSNRKWNTTSGSDFYSQSTADLND